MRGPGGDRQPAILKAAPGVLVTSPTRKSSPGSGKVKGKGSGKGSDRVHFSADSERRLFNPSSPAEAVRDPSRGRSPNRSPTPPGDRSVRYREDSAADQNEPEGNEGWQAPGGRPWKFRGTRAGQKKNVPWGGKPQGRGKGRGKKGK